MASGRRRLFFDEKRHDPDLVDVLEAAGVLEISEFELFHRAYEWWHGHDASEKDVETYYLPYMFRDRVPLWVRQYSRAVLNEDERGTLDPKNFGVLPREVSRSAFDRGIRYCLWLVVIMFVFMTMIIAYERLIQYPIGCIVPPCY